MSEVQQCNRMRKTVSASVSSAGSVKILDANSARIGFRIWNNSSNSGYLAYGDAASSAQPTVLVATFATHSELGPVVYTGDIYAIRNSGSGTFTCWEYLRT
jgi:hypothetical protein